MPETKVDNEGGSGSTEPPDDNNFVEVDPTQRYGGFNGGGSGSTESPDDNDFVEVDPTGRYGRYKDVLGKGAFKTVYRAFDEVDGIEVAWNQVKIDDLLQNPDNMERLYSEVHLLKTVKHKNIIKFYSSWIDDKNKTVNIITEIFTSGTLRQYRKKHKHVDMKAVKGWARQVLQGLRYLHSHNPPIIHRDLKCDNIFVNGNHGEVKIGDLGLATIMRQAHVHSVIGTPEFMAPELYEEDYDELVDIYSFGMCLLEMVTFEYPYSECNNQAQIYKKVTSGVKPAALNKIKDPQTRAFIEKCLVAAPQRLPANELLLDPFLQCDGYKESADCNQPSTSVMPGTGDKKEAFPVLEEGGTSGNDEISSISNDVNVVSYPASEYSSADTDGEYQIPPGSGIEIICSSLSLASLEVRSSSNGKDFKLIGVKEDDNSIFLRLRIADHEGRARIIRFRFYIKSDTALGVANEMIQHIGLSDEEMIDATDIADLIDTFIEELVPGWKPGDSTDETIRVNEDPAENVPDENDLHKADQYQMEKLLDSVPTALIVEAVKIDDEPSIVNQYPPTESSSVECFAPIRCEGNMHGRFEEFTYNQSGYEYSPSSYIAPISYMGEDQASQVSLNSEATIMGSVCSESENIPIGTHQCLGPSDAARTDAFPASDKVEDSGEHEMVIALNQDTVGVDHAHLIGKENIVLPERSSCPNEVISHSSKGLMNTVSSLSVDNEDEDEELRGQIELIERHYQNELQELYRRRQQDIDEIRKTWNQKKQACSQSSGLSQYKQINGHASAVDLEANTVENSGRISLKEITTKTNNALAMGCNVPVGDNLSKAVNREHLENVEMLQLSSNIDYPKESGLVYNKDHQLMDLQTNSIVEVHLLESCIDLSTAESLHTKPFTAIINLGHDADAIVKIDGHCSDLKGSHFSAQRHSRNNCFVEDHICKPSEVPSGVHEQHKGILKESLTTRQENSSEPLQKNGFCGMQQKDLCVLTGRMKPRVAPASLASGSLELKVNVTANGMMPKNEFSRTYDNVVPGPIECEVAPPLFEVVHQQNEKSAAVHDIHCSVNKSDCISRAFIAEELCKVPTKEREKPPSLRLEKSNSPPDSPGLGRGIRSGVDPALEQRRKEQLQKSIAELEAKTLEGLKHSKNGYFIGLLSRK